jgi:hypothetical protein
MFYFSCVDSKSRSIAASLVSRDSAPSPVPAISTLARIESLSFIDVHKEATPHMFSYVYNAKDLISFE